MSAQEHEYELGMLDHETLERDESLARHNRQRGDERRWMILGGAGTLALMTALFAAVALGGNSEPRHLASSLGSPARDLAAVAAKAVTAQSESEAKAEAAKPARVARKATPATAPEVAKPLDEPAPAKTSSAASAAAAIPAATAPAAASAPTQAKASPSASESEAESEDNAFAGLPSLPTVDEPDDASEPEADAPVDFTHDDNPFVDEDEDEDEDDEDEDEGDEAAPAPAPAPAPA